jgi:hypothetical protein
MQTAATSAAIPVADEWCRQHFDYLSPQLSGVLLPTMAAVRRDHLPAAVLVLDVPG